MCSEVPRQQWLTFLDPATCTRKGLCPVKEARGTPSYSLYFEQHGTGPVKVVFVMGLNASCNSWFAQVKHFSLLPQYSVLVFDNRGVGNSDTPMGPYSFVPLIAIVTRLGLMYRLFPHSWKSQTPRTSGMAEDVIVLLDFLGWTEKRSLHLVGLSLGGMIAQELSYRVPERFISLTLCVTTAGGFPLCNVPPWVGFKNLLRQQLIRDPEGMVPYFVETRFNTSWLDAIAENDATLEGRTNREVQVVIFKERMALTRIQKPLGSISQMWAGFTHHVQPGRLTRISKTIPKVVILTGDDDHLVRPTNSAYLKKHMPEAEYIVWKDTGHVVNLQHVERFNALLERVFHEGDTNMAGRI